MLRLMQPLDGAATADPFQRKRRLLADLCRLIGNEVNGRNGNGNGHAHHPNGNGDHSAAAAAVNAIDVLLKTQCLSRRMEQTLRSLLGGDSEKQVAAKLGLSPHTIHVYVKALYKKYGVSTRAELLAKWVQNQPS